jgi:hypothetical protein
VSPHPGATPAKHKEAPRRRWPASPSVPPAPCGSHAGPPRTSSCAGRRSAPARRPSARSPSSSSCPATRPRQSGRRRSCPSRSACGPSPQCTGRPGGPSTGSPETLRAPARASQSRPPRAAAAQVVSQSTVRMPNPGERCGGGGGGIVAHLGVIEAPALSTRPRARRAVHAAHTDCRRHGGRLELRAHLVVQVTRRSPDHVGAVREARLRESRVSEGEPAVCSAISTVHEIVGRQLANQGEDWPGHATQKTQASAQHPP